MQEGYKIPQLALVFQRARQWIDPPRAKEGAAKIKRLRTEQGKRPSCFEYPGGQLIEVISLQQGGPVGPCLAGLHEESIA